MSKYRYPNSKKVYTLVSISGCIYRFKCGHWCTDNVFQDLINIKTGLAKWQMPELFTEL
jgi:hypothetical protein